MSRPELILYDIQKLNERYWAQIAPLERKVLEVEKAYLASTRPSASIGDVLNRTDPAFFFNQQKQLRELNDLATKINELYINWERDLSYIKLPPPNPGRAGSFASKIPWPSVVPPGVRRRLTRVIEQGGIPISKRVQVIPARGPYSGTGAAIEFAKW